MTPRHLITRSTRTTSSVALAGIAAGTTLVIALRFGGIETASLPGIPEPGRIALYGLPFLRFVGELLACVCAGLLLVELLRRPRDGSIGSTEARSTVPLTAAAGLWAADSLAQLAFSYADYAAVSLRDAISPRTLITYVGDGVQPRALVLQMTGALVIALSTYAIRRRHQSLRTTSALLVLVVLSTLPVPLSGHAYGEEGRAVAMASLTLHVGAATLWLGGILALLARRPSSGTHVKSGELVHLTTRFSALAIWCYAAVLASGTANAVVRLPHVSDLLTSHYGVLILLKIGAVAVIAALGALHRRRTLPALANGDTAMFRRVLGVEAMFMVLTFAIAVALGHSAPPS